MQVLFAIISGIGAAIAIAQFPSKGISRSLKRIAGAIGLGLFINVLMTYSTRSVQTYNKKFGL